MRPINHIQQRVTNFVLKEIKLKYHAINTDNYKKGMFIEIKH